MTLSEFDGIGVKRGECVTPQCHCSCYRMEEGTLDNLCIACQHSSALHQNIDQRIMEYRDDNNRYQYNNEPFKAFEGLATEPRVKVVLYGQCNAKECQCEGFLLQEGQTEHDRIMAFHKGSCCSHRAFLHKPIGVEEMTTQVDIRDVVRGQCTIEECFCEGYSRLQCPPEGKNRNSWHWCGQCLHSPVHHLNLGSSSGKQRPSVKLYSEQCRDSDCDCPGFTTQDEGSDIAWKKCEYCEHAGVAHQTLRSQQKEVSPPPIPARKSSTEVRTARLATMEDLPPEELEEMKADLHVTLEETFHSDHEEEEEILPNESPSQYVFVKEVFHSENPNIKVERRYEYTAEYHSVTYQEPGGGGVYIQEVYGDEMPKEEDMELPVITEEEEEPPPSRYEAEARSSDEGSHVVIQEITLEDNEEMSKSVDGTRSKSRSSHSSSSHSSKSSSSHSSKSSSSHSSSSSSQGSSTDGDSSDTEGSDKKEEVEHREKKRMKRRESTTREEGTSDSEGGTNKSRSSSHQHRPSQSEDSDDEDSQT